MSNRLAKNTKKNTEERREEIAFYNAVGKVFVICGIVSFVLMGFVALMPQDYEKYNIPLAFGIWTAISVFLIVLGILPQILGKKSRRFQKWAEKDFASFEQHMIKQAKKELEREKKKQLKKQKKQ
ncbi:MAG: hypothetical protein MR529_05585 [Cuneatibacter sp.]|nr:hypothetical protein [Cuneatibacter sp.]